MTNVTTDDFLVASDSLQANSLSITLGWRARPPGVIGHIPS